MFHSARTVIRRISKNGVRYSSHDKPTEPIRIGHMNDVPVPQGCWKKNYDKKQKIYNTQLVVGLSMLSATIAFIVQSDKFFFNAFPPKLQ